MGSVVSASDEKDLDENFITEEYDEGSCEEFGADSLRIPARSKNSDIRRAERFLKDNRVKLAIKPEKLDEIRNIQRQHQSLE